MRNAMGRGQGAVAGAKWRLAPLTLALLALAGAAAAGGPGSRAFADALAAAAERPREARTGADVLTPTAARRWSFTIRTMGTQATVTLFGQDSLEVARQAFLAGRDFMRVDSLMSNWTTTSEVARINRMADTTTVTVHPEVARVIDEALRVGAQSGGTYDITVEPLVRAWGFIGGPRRVPDSTEVEAARRLIDYRLVRFDPTARSLHFEKPGVHIDLGSLGKGYAAETAAATLQAQGVRVGLVDLSGKMVALGAPPGKPGWIIGLRDPKGRLPELARLTLRDGGIATSGKYEQFVTKNGHAYGHILNPKTGWPAEGLISVTVLCRSALTADAWSTAFFAMGPDEAKRISHARDDLDVALVTPGVDRDTLWVEENLRTRCVIEEKSAPFLIVKFY